MTNQRKLFPLTAKFSSDEVESFESLRVALGTERSPASISDTLRHALKVACQVEKIDWPAVDS